ncbi:amidase family protein [Abortiporus biennis]
MAATTATSQPIHWKDIVAEKRQRQTASIPKEWIIDPPPSSQLDVTSFPDKCGLLTDRELEITNTTDVDVILKKLASAEWSSVEVTTAFYKRAIVAQQLVNCLTEIFVDEALARAAELDAHLKSTGKVVGPLHGLPISLKDQFKIKSHETTMGYVSWIGKYADSNSALVDILYECGAVPFVQTNVPQTLMWAETYNVIFGRTLNPNNRNLTSGGSSGGEGALIAMKGSPLGVGSDIGGSIRIPSGFNGLYGMRPSYNRVPYANAVNSMEGQESILSVFGPISNNISGLKAFMKAVVDSKPWLKDPLALRKKWDEEAYALLDRDGGKKLCFGILWNDGQSVPHPPITRGLEITKAALLAAGHEVVDWKPYKHAEMVDVISGIWDSGAEEDFATVTAPTGEPILTSMYDLEAAVKTEAAFRPPEGQPTMTAYQLWQLHKTKLQLRQEHLNYWQSSVSLTGTGRPVDAIISPVAPRTAPTHGNNIDAAYTTVWNGHDSSVCVVPITKVDPVLDAKKPRSNFLSAADERNYQLYDSPETFVDAPVSVQIVGQTQEEEAVLGMAEIVDAAVKAYKATSA